MSDGARVRILLVEDSDDDAVLVERALRTGGLDAEIRRVDTLDGLERALAEFSPDAVLCDYRMPRLTAQDALAAVRAATPELPFLCVSGTVGEEQAVELLKAGATDYVLKDKPARLVPNLRRAFAERRERAERRRAEEELRQSREQFLQAQKMEAVGRLAGGVAHDFNNILTTISGYSELLLQALPAESPYRDEIGEILAAAERAARLTRQLLAFSRRQVMEVRVIDLNDVVRGVERMLARVIGEDVRLTVSLAPELKRTRADVSQLEVALLNLAVNARDAMPKGGVLRISTRAAGERVALDVADTGAGMTPEVRARVFEPFFTTKEKGKGTGLGLSTVYGIVQQSGGTIDLESEPGRGTTFRIYLPATDEAAEQPRVETEEPDPTGGREVILVVEDEAPLRQLMRRILDARGYRVIVAAGPEEALRALDSEPKLALAIVDVVMPVMDGPTLVERMRRSRPRLKALFVSGYTDQAALPVPKSGHSFPFLAKPFASAVLLAKIRELLSDKA